MIKLHLPLLVSAMLTMTFCVHAQDHVLLDDTLTALDSAANEKSNANGETQISNELKESTVAPTEDSLWQDATANPSLESLSVYLAAFPNGKYSDDAKSKFQALENKARARAQQDKELEAYRKRRTVGGLVLELDSKFHDVKPYIRSTLNSCGYVLVQPHRFAKRVYPTLTFGGRMFNGQSDGEHTVTLDLLLALKTHTREIKAREKMRSYRASNVDTHQALLAAFEDVGAQMASSGFCVN